MGNQHSLTANRNCPTNSLPYGYGGLTADTSVLPVRIIMLPTSSSRLLTGRKPRSATALINSRDPPDVVAAQAAGAAVSLRHRRPKHQLSTVCTGRGKPPCAQASAWYVAAALSAWRWSCGILAGVGMSLAAAACGSSGQKQSAGEPKGDFPVKISAATFPTS